MRRWAPAAMMVAALLVAPLASAALEGPQADYRSKVEPICEAEGKATVRIFPPRGRVAPVGKETSELKKTGARFVRASKRLAQALTDMRAIPRPEADAQKLAKWLGQISEQAQRLRQAGKSLKEDRRSRAQKLINQFSFASSRANNLVVSYEFRHCVFGGAGFTP